MPGVTLSVPAGFCQGLWIIKVQRMLLSRVFFFGMTLALGVSACAESGNQKAEPREAKLRARSLELARNFIIIDTHIDVPYRMGRALEDISKRTAGGDFDYPRAREGGLDAAFFSIYVPAEYQLRGGARALADGLIDMVERFERDAPEKFRIAREPSDIRQNSDQGIFSIALGIENGAAIGGDLDNVRHFSERGVRYITLTHSKANEICDSSYDPERKWNGLSPFGREVVAEMNRLGIMVDISHVSDETFFQVLQISQVPVIASHSSCRKFTPGWERNMSDEMIQRLAAKGGVIQINFGSDFVSEEYRQGSEQMRQEMETYLAERGILWGDPALEEHVREYRKTHPVPFADVSDVADHIEHVVQLVGVDHVGFGSDFDGVGDSLPTGLKDVSAYPNLIFELLKRGYGENDVERICSGNLLRVWSEARVFSQEGGKLKNARGNL